MRELLKWAVVMSIVGAATVSVAQEEDLEFTTSSEEFRAAFSQAVETLGNSSLPDEMEAGGLGSMSNDEFENQVSFIREERPLEYVSAGAYGHRYDVILQPGHYGRRTGRVGTSGRLVSERALTAHLVDRMATELRSRGLDVLVVPADGYLRNTAVPPAWNGLTTRVFLAVHADGSTRPCSTGPSLGYGSSSSLLAMHAIGFGLSQALGITYEEFMRDNLTVNTSQYYMFNHVKADVMQGVLEVGELTCEQTERQLIELSREISLNVARALHFVANPQP